MSGNKTPSHPSPQSPDRLDLFIEELSQKGNHATDGRFSLDREKARQKMRQFQLADPHRYVLPLVQSAVLKEASRIRFDIDADDMNMRFDGRPFTVRDFEEIYESLFVDWHDPVVLARRELALGLNAAMALNPRQIRVVSGDGKKGVELLLRSDRPDVYNEIATEVEGTLIHVKSRFRPGLAVRFVENIKGTLPEERILRERCRFCPAVLDLEGEILSEGGKLVERMLSHAIGVSSFQKPSVQILSGFLPEQAGGKMVLLKQGVWIATHPVETSASGFVAVVEDDSLRKDVSGGDIVKDEAYEGVGKHLSRAMHGSLMALCAEVESPQAHAFDSGYPLPWALGLLKQAVLLYGSLKMFTSAAVESLPYHLARTPLFDTLEERRISIIDLDEKLVRDGYVPYTFKTGEELASSNHLSPERFEEIVKGQSVLSVRSDRDHKLLKGLFGQKLVSVEERIVRAARRDRNIRIWKSMPARPALDRNRVLVFETVEGPGFRGEVGFPRDMTFGGRLFCIKDGCLLQEVLATGKFGFMAVVEADFTPNEMYDGVMPDSCYAEVVTAVLLRLGALYASLVSKADNDPLLLSGIRGHVTGFLKLALSDDPVFDFLRAFEIDTSNRIEKGFNPSMELVPALGAGSVPPGVPSPFSSCSLFRTAEKDPTWISLEEIQARIENKGSIGWISEKSPVGAGVGFELLVLSPNEAFIMERVFGAAKLKNHDQECLFSKMQEEFMIRPVEAIEVDAQGRSCFHVSFKAEGMKGDVCVWNDWSQTGAELGKPWKAKLLFHERKIARREIKLLFPPGEAVVTCDGLKPDALWNDVENDEAVTLVRWALIRTFEAVATVLARHVEDVIPRLRAKVDAFLAQTLSHIIPAPAFGAAFRALGPTGSEEDPDSSQRYQRLLDLTAWSEPDQIYSALAEVLDRGILPEAEAVDQRIVQMFVRVPQMPALEIDLSDMAQCFVEGSPARNIRVMSLSPEQGFLPFISSVASVPFFTESRKRKLSLLEVMRAFRRQGALHFSRYSISVADLQKEAILLVLGRYELMFLRRVLGEQGLLPVEDLPAGSAPVVVSSGRLQLSSSIPCLTLDPDSVLVKVSLNKDGILGEMGLSSRPEGGSTLTLIRDGKEAGRACDFSPLGLVVRVQDSRLALSPTGLSVERNDRLYQVVKICHEELGALARALYDRWPHMDQKTRAVASIHAAAMLAFQLNGYDGDEMSLDQDPVGNVLCDLPCFELAGGGFCTLMELGESYEENGRISFVQSKVSGQPLDPKRRVLSPDPRVLASLRVLFLNLEDYSERWHLDRLATRVLGEDTQPLPDPDKHECLARSPFSFGDFKGELFLPADPDLPLGVALGVSGRQLERISASDVFPCAGALELPVHVLQSKSVSSADQIPQLLGDEGRSLLESEAYRLYVKLLERFGKEAAGRDPAARLAWMRLSHALSALHGWMGADDKRTKRFEPFYYMLRNASIGLLSAEEKIDIDALLQRPGALDQLVARRFDDRRLDDRPGFEETELLREGTVRIEPITVAEPPSDMDSTLRLSKTLHEMMEVVSDRNDKVRGFMALRPVGFAMIDSAGPAYCDNDALILNRRHPLVAQALAAKRPEPFHTALLLSAIYTAVNILLEEVTDDHERDFQHLLARYVSLTNLAESR